MLPLCRRSNLHKQILNVWRNKQTIPEFTYIEPKQTPDPLIMYNMKIKKAATKNNFKQLEILFQEMKKKQVKPDIITYTTIMKCFDKNNNREKVKQYFQMLGNDQIKLDITACNTLLRTFKDDHQRSESIKNYMIENGIEFNSNTCTIIFNNYFFHQNIKRAERFYEELISTGKESLLDLDFYNSLLVVYKLTKKFDKMEETFELIKSKKIVPNFKTFIVLIDAYSEVHDLEKMDYYFQQMLAQTSLIVEERAFHMILSEAASQKNEKLFYKYFEEFKNTQVPTLLVYNILLKFYSAINREDKVTETLIEMTDLGIQPCATTLNTLVDYFISHGKLENAEALFEKIARDNPNLLTVVIFSTFIDAFGKQNQIHLVEKYFTLLKEYSVEPDTHLYVSLIRTYGRNNIFEKVDEILEEMKFRSLLPVSVYTLLFRFCLENNNQTRLDHYYNQCFAQNAPSQSELESLLLFFVRERRFDKADDILNKLNMKEREVFNKVVYIYGSQGAYTQLSDVFFRFATKDALPDPKTIGMIANYFGDGKLYHPIHKLRLFCNPWILTRTGLDFLRAYVKCDRLDTAVNHFNAMKSPNEHAYSIIIPALVNGNKLAVAEDIFLKLKQTSLPVLDSVLLAMIRVYEQTDRPQSAANLRTQLKTTLLPNALISPVTV